MHKILIKIISLFTLLTSFFITLETQAKDLAVMLYIADQKIGDKIYDQYLKDLGLVRNLNPNGPFNYEYHVTVGYIKNVQTDDVNNLKEYLHNNLYKELENANFEFGVAALLGCSSPYLIALPKNPQVFIGYNKLLHSILQKYKDGKYTLDKRTLPDVYTPHLSLNGQLHKNIKSDNIYNLLIEINKRMLNAQIKLDKLEIR